MKVKITYISGLTETVIQESAATLEEFCNIHFGSAWEQAKEFGATVEEVIEEAALEVEVLLGMSTMDLGAINTDQIQSLTTEQLSALKPEEIKAQ
jgi:hypothetical protein